MAAKKDRIPELDQLDLEIVHDRLEGRSIPLIGIRILVKTERFGNIDSRWENVTRKECYMLAS